MPAHSCSKRNGVPNIPGQWVQDGWVDEWTPERGRIRVPRMVWHITEWLEEVTCGYVHRATDQDCAHCHRAQL